MRRLATTMAWLLAAPGLFACHGAAPASGPAPAGSDAGSPSGMAPPAGETPSDAAGAPAVMDGPSVADTGGAPPIDGAPPPGPVAVPKTVVLDGQKLADARRRLAEGDAQLGAVLAALRAAADRDLTAGPWSVMDKTTTPPSGNKHDYLSLARYYWPTPGAANGCPYLHRDGETNPETSGNKYDHASRHAAMDAVYHLAAAWYFTGEARYAERAALVIRTWFLDPATAMNPNINFGEGVPCLRNGANTGVLNWTEVIGEALDGMAILDTGAPGWSSADQAGMRTWLTAFLKWLQTNALATDEAGATNNHGTWYDAGVSAIMLALGQADAARALVEGARVKRIASQIKGDGTQPGELARTNSWGYANWNLEGFCLLAATGSRLGVDLWAYAAPGGGTIAKAIDYLIPGAEHGQGSWPHRQISPFEPSWPMPLFHAAADFASDATARAALPLVPAGAAGDLWPLLPVCTTPAIQVN
jgi:hypothetical protein